MKHLRFNGGWRIKPDSVGVGLTSRSRLRDYVLRSFVGKFVGYAHLLEEIEEYIDILISRCFRTSMNYIVQFY